MKHLCEMLHDTWREQMKAETGPEAGPAGVAWLEDLGIVAFTGGDAANFLQGYYTSDTEVLSETPTRTAICNRTGRVVANGWTWLAEDAVLLVVHRSLAEPLLAFLKPYLAFARCEASDLSNECLVFGLTDTPCDEARPLDVERSLAIADDLQTAERIWACNDAHSAAAWQAREVALHEVWVTTATSERFLPQMLALTDGPASAVSFTKGCYLGQEVVARAEHRGQVKRVLTRLEWRGSAPHAGDDVLNAEQRVIGTVVQVSGSEDVGAALAVLGRDDQAAGAADDQTRFHHPA